MKPTVHVVIAEGVRGGHAIVAGVYETWRVADSARQTANVGFNRTPGTIGAFRIVTVDFIPKRPRISGGRG